MLTVENIDMTLLNQGISGLIRKCGIDSKVVVEKETGELIKTLVRISPPKDRTKTRLSVARRLSTVFEAAGYAKYLDSRINPGGITWTRHTKRFLYGTANELDWRNVNDVRRVAHLSYQLRATGRRVVPFLHPRKVQKVSLSQAVFLQAGMLQRVTKYLQSHVGRLKAGWLVASAAGRIRFTSANAAPQWVTRHVPGAHGRFVDELDAPEWPAFTIANFAKGITSRAASGIAQTAVNIRGKAIAQNARMFLSGKKNVGDYAKWATSN